MFKYDFTPLNLYVPMNKSEIVKLLIQHNDLQMNLKHHEDNAVFHHPVYFEYTACVLSLSSPRNIHTEIQNASYETLLTIALRLREIDGIRELLRISTPHTSRRDFFAKNMLSNSMLSIDSFEFLINTGLFNINEHNEKGETSLFSAASFVEAPCFCLLLND